LSQPGAEERAKRIRPPRRRRTGVAGWALRLLLAGAAFAIGIAVGQALGESPEPDGRATYIRTLEPGSIGSPAPTVTVTVTITSP